MSRATKLLDAHCEELISNLPTCTSIKEITVVLYKFVYIYIYIYIYIN